MAGWLWERVAARGCRHEAAQDGEGVVAVLAGGVDVTVDVQPVLGGVFADEAAGDLLLGLQGPDAPLAEVVRRPDPGVANAGQDAGVVDSRTQDLLDEWIVTVFTDRRESQMASDLR